MRHVSKEGIEDLPPDGSDQCVEQGPHLDDLPLRPPSHRTARMIASQSPHDTDPQAVARGDAMLAEELGLLIDGATTYAIYMLDRRGRVTIWNRGAERIKGWAEAEIIGRDFAIFYPADDIAAGNPPPTSPARTAMAGSRKKAGGSARTAPNSSRTSRSPRSTTTPARCAGSAR